MDKLRALLKGGQQGVTMGAADEMAGAIPAALDALGIGGGITAQNKALADAGFTGDIGPKSSNELYKQSRNEDRAEVALADKENPGAYNAGLAGGALLTALSPLPSTLRAETMGSALARGAGYGATQGLGSSTKEDMLGQAQDALSGAAIGAAGGAAFQKLKGLMPQSGVLNAKGGFGKVRGPDMEEIKDISHKQIQDRMVESGVADKLSELKDRIGLGPMYDALKQKATNMTKDDLIRRLKKNIEEQE